MLVQQQRGILKAIFVADGSIIHATAEVDQIGVLANLQVLVNASLDMSKMHRCLFLCLKVMERDIAC